MNLHHIKKNLLNIRALQKIEFEWWLNAQLNLNKLENWKITKKAYKKSLEFIKI